MQGLPARPVDPAITAMDEQDRIRLARLVLTLRRKGVDAAVLAAIEQAPRKIFAAAEDRLRAFDDRPLPLECGQTATAPSTIGLMIKALRVGPEHRVLEIGTGSGFAAAVLARMARSVHTVERWRGLVEAATERFVALRLGTVQIALADGAHGWPEAAPFDRILVSASALEVPPDLLGQLSMNGILVMPLGAPGEPQIVTRVVRRPDGFHVEPVLEARFAPLIPGIAAAL